MHFKWTFTGSFHHLNLEIFFFFFCFLISREETMKQMKDTVHQIEKKAASNLNRYENKIVKFFAHQLYFHYLISIENFDFV